MGTKYYFISMATPRPLPFLFEDFNYDTLLHNQPVIHIISVKIV